MERWWSAFLRRFRVTLTYSQMKSNFKFRKRTAERGNGFVSTCGLSVWVARILLFCGSSRILFTCQERRRTKAAVSACLSVYLFANHMKQISLTKRAKWKVDAFPHQFHCNRIPIHSSRVTKMVCENLRTKTMAGRRQKQQQQRSV